MDRLVGLPTAGSHEVGHLATVTALRSPHRGAGSWFHLSPENAHYTRSPNDLSSLDSGAAADPRPATRRRRPSVHAWAPRPFVSASLTRELVRATAATLQRLEGLGGGLDPPRGVRCSLSWGFAALRGHRSGGPGRLFVPVQPVRRFHALRAFIQPDLPPRPKPGRGPPCAFAPLQR